MTDADRLNELEKRVIKLENFFKWMEESGNSFLVTPTPKKFNWRRFWE